MDWQNYKSETTTIKFFFFCLPLEILFDGDLVFAASWDSQNAVILGKKLIWGHFNTSINCFYPPYNYLNVFSSLGALIACFGIGSHSFWQTDELFSILCLYLKTQKQILFITEQNKKTVVSNHLAFSYAKHRNLIGILFLHVCLKCYGIKVPLQSYFGQL